MSAETTSLRDIANSVNFKDFNAMFNKAWKEFDDANRSIMEIVEAAIKDFEQHITAFGILQVNKKYIPKILINRGVFDIFPPTSYLEHLFLNRKLAGYDVELVRMPFAKKTGCLYFGDPDGCGHSTGYRRTADLQLAGNAQKMRDALEELVSNIEMRASVFDIFSIIDRKTFLDAKAALAAPPRNCDVGTTEEQTARYNKFCYDNKTAERSCGDCPAYSAYAITKKDCHLSWAQMPYEKGGAK